MRVDLDIYAINRQFIKNWYQSCIDRGAEVDIGKGISICAASTHCPCIAMAFYLSEELGFTKELTNTIDNLIKFYDYTEITGQKTNSPYLSLDRFRDIKS